MDKAGTTVSAERQARRHTRGLSAGALSEDLLVGSLVCRPRRSRCQLWVGRLCQEAYSQNENIEHLNEKLAELGQVLHPAWRSARREFGNPLVQR